MTKRMLDKTELSPHDIMLTLGQQTYLLFLNHTSSNEYIITLANVNDVNTDTGYLGFSHEVYQTKIYDALPNGSVRCMNLVVSLLETCTDFEYPVEVCLELGGLIKGQRPRLPDVKLAYH